MNADKKMNLCLEVRTRQDRELSKPGQGTRNVRPYLLQGRGDPMGGAGTA